MIIYSNIIWTCVGWYCLFSIRFHGRFLAARAAYGRNYFEATDGLIWVVDSADRQRLEDCRQELVSWIALLKLVKLVSWYLPSINIYQLNNST